jgi:cell division protease FtsH
VSDATAQAIDREVRGLVDRAHDRALAILRHNRELLDSISHKILDKEVIEGDELRDLLASSTLPAEAALQAVAA